MKTHKNIKVVLMVSAPLTERWKAIYCTDVLASVFDFEYWDCSSVVALPFGASKKLERDYVYTISSNNELKDKVAGLPKDVVIIEEIPFRKENTLFHTYVSKKARTIIHFDFFEYNIIGAMNNKQSSQADITFSFKTKAKTILYKSDLLKLLIKLLFRGKKEFQKQYQFIREERRIKKILKENNSTKYKQIINFSYKPQSQYSIIHPDYEKFLSVDLSQERLLPYKYIVFIDQYFPLHPDLQMDEPNIDYNALVAPYFASMNHFFDTIENETGLPVIIAPHPSAHYNKNPYNGRKMMYYKTAELIKDCEAVCMHGSNALNFVALWNKPLMLINNRAISVPHNLLKYNIAFAESLNMPLYDIDTITFQKGMFSRIDCNIRQKFLNGFINSVLRKQTNAQLLTEYIVDVHSKIVNHK